MKNCPNCGAPYDTSEKRCPYCGTAYFDMTTLDFDSHEPFFMKIKTNGFYVTQLVRPTDSDITVDCNTTHIIGKFGETLASFDTEKTLSTTLSFTAIPFANNNLMLVEKEIE